MFNAKKTPKNSKKHSKTKQIDISPRNHHKQVIAPKQGYPLQVSQACRGIKRALKEATYKQRLPSSSLKNWEILLKQVQKVNYPDWPVCPVQTSK